MDLSKVQEALAPGALEALKIPLSYDEFRELCLLTYIDTAVKQYGGVQNRAAMRIGVTPATVSKAISGKSLTRHRGGGGAKPEEQK